MYRRLGEVGIRLRYGWLGIVETTGAASVAWLVDTRWLGHRQAFFAPAAALIVLGQARGQRIRRAIEILIGVAGGIFIADLVARALGPHSTSTVFVVIFSTMLVAVVLNAGPLLVVQASVSALYVAVVTPPGSAAVTNRFVDALVGGCIAVVVSQLRVVREPLRPLVRQVDETFGDLAAIFEQIGAALAANDEAAAREVLTRARGADAGVTKLHNAVLAAEEGLLLRVHRQRRVAGVRVIEQSVNQVDYAVRGSRVLARATVTVTRQHSDVPDGVVTSLQLLAAQARHVQATFIAELGSDNERVRAAVAAAQEAAAAAVHAAAGALDSDSSLPVVMLVGQIRLTAVDLLRAGDADDLDLLERLDSMLGLVIR